MVLSSEILNGDDEGINLIQRRSLKAQVERVI